MKVMMRKGFVRGRELAEALFTDFEAS